MKTSRFEYKTCAKCKRKFDPLEVRTCTYSKTGAIICFWCCKKCPYIRHTGNHWQCGFKKPKGETE